MTPHTDLLARKLEHLRRMRTYLVYSHEHVTQMAPINWTQLNPEQHETLAAFRVRFSDFQVQLGKTMRAVVIEEEQVAEPFIAVLLLIWKNSPSLPRKTDGKKCENFAMPSTMNTKKIRRAWPSFLMNSHGSHHNFLSGRKIWNAFA